MRERRGLPTGPRPATPPPRLRLPARFHISEPPNRAHVRARTCVHACKHTCSSAYETPGRPHLQVRLSEAGLTRDVRTFRAPDARRMIARGSPERGVYPFTMWTFSRPRADSLRKFPRRRAATIARTSCGFEDYRTRRRAADRKNSLRSTRERVSAARLSRSSFFPRTLACAGETGNYPSTGPRARVGDIG